tara:strand:- start:5994 stop:9536 length:3543 start_codon:yes stop_codon:yes gene_type:complete
MIRKNLKYKISGIKENNLKNLDFEGETGEVIVISGVSGSGKSTLVNQVIAAEARRQSIIRKKTDDIYYYSVRPLFRTATKIPDPVIVSQRAITPSVSSTFGTRTGINNLIINLFVKKGEIHHLKKLIGKPDISTIIEFRIKYHPNAALLGRISNYENVSHSKLLALLTSLSIEHLFIRNEGGKAVKKVALNKLPNIRLDRHEIFIDLDQSQNIKLLISKTRATPFIINDSVELDCSEYGLSLDDGKSFKLPSKLLFSRSTMSSLSGCCSKCDGSGSYITYDCSSVIDTKAIIEEGFLKVPLTASGRYKGFKYLPSGFVRLLKKQGIDTKTSFSGLSKIQKDTVIDILNDKLSKNRNDPYTDNFSDGVQCEECLGTGLNTSARAVTINGKSIDFFFTLCSSDLHEELLQIQYEDDYLKKAMTVLSYISKLSIGHISLNRSTATLSSGELQRLKLLSVLLNKYSGRVVVIDEPSSNLQYKDNLKIVGLIKELKARNNSVIIVDHNPIYAAIADRELKIGPGSGDLGGRYCEVADLSDRINSFKDFENLEFLNKKFPLRIISFEDLRNINLKKVRILEKSITAVIGASGSGKTTLCRDLIYPALSATDEVMFFDSKPAQGSFNSIVATYLNVSDRMRKFYSSNMKSDLKAADFSFNSSGACDRCGGRGLIDGHVCGVCMGSRFKPDSALFQVEGMSIIDLLCSDLKEIPLNGGFSFLYDVVQVLNKLSLSHISLGRETSSLSGGELQRLKLAKFILFNKNRIESKKFYIILDEPCRGLDPESVDCLYQALNFYLKDTTVIVIEHNPQFIYKCQYIIDLGEGSGVKNQKTVVQGFVGEKDFPSLNHYNIMSKLISDYKINIDTENDQGLNIEDDFETRNIAGKKIELIPPLLISQKNFALEDKYSRKFIAYGDYDSFFYKNKESLEAGLSHYTEFFYNPFVVFLEKYPIVPDSLIKETVKKIDKSLVVCSSNVWDYKVCALSFEEAYVKGGGVVIISTQDYKYQYHGVRLFSVRDRIADKVFPEKFAFNLYKNSCDYCEGYGYIKSYPFKQWIKRSLSILDSSFIPYQVQKYIPKTAINRFYKEGLFDFSLPFNKLTKQEMNILLYGFKEYKFKKAGKLDDSESSFIEWRGLNSYVYRNSVKLSPKKDINTLLQFVECPFCSNGISNKSDYYNVDGVPFSDFLK